MKKEFLKNCVLGISAAICCCLFSKGLTAKAVNLHGQNNEEKIFWYMMEEAEMNNAASCGVLANIAAESSFNPKAEGDGGDSFGICQWNKTRYSELKRYCERYGYDYRSLEGQLVFLKNELSTDYYFRVNVYNRLKNVENSENGSYDSGYAWCYYFENPAFKEVKAPARGYTAKTKYWPKYKDYVLKLTVGQSYKTDKGTFIATSESEVSFAGMPNKKATKLTIPAWVKIGNVQAKVTSISMRACKNRKKLKSVTIGKYVTTIGKGAFNGCKNLDTIKIKSKDITEFGQGCFKRIKSGATFYVKKSVMDTYEEELEDVATAKFKMKKLK